MKAIFIKQYITLPAWAENAFIVFLAVALMISVLSAFPTQRIQSGFKTPTRALAKRALWAYIIVIGSACMGPTVFGLAQVIKGQTLTLRFGNDTVLTEYNQWFVFISGIIMVYSCIAANILYRRTNKMFADESGWGEERYMAPPDMPPAAGENT